MFRHKIRAIGLATIITTTLLLIPMANAIGAAGFKATVQTPDATMANCKPGTVAYWEAPLTTTIIVNGGPKNVVSDVGPAAFTWDGPGTVKQYWAQGVASLYGELARSNGNGYVLIAGQPIPADDSWADGGCDANGNLCWGAGWVQIIQPDLTITVSGSFDRCGL